MTEKELCDQMVANLYQHETFIDEALESRKAEFRYACARGDVHLARRLVYGINRYISRWYDRADVPPAPDDMPVFICFDPGMQQAIDEDTRRWKAAGRPPMRLWRCRSGGGFTGDDGEET